MPLVCPTGSSLCGEPHMQGLRGQRINWSGVDGGWYCLVKDQDADFQVNVRLTAPQPEDFPDRQLVTGLSVISDENSLVVEVKDPYTTVTGGCSGEQPVCLANGGLSVSVNGQEAGQLLLPTRDAYVADGIHMSASNLPVECRQFGGDKLWALMYAKMLQDERELQADTFEDWVLSVDQMAAPEWCAKYIAEHGLSKVQSIHAIFKIMTPTFDLRLNAGFGYQVGGEINWDGRVLTDLEFWQMDVGLDGLAIDNEHLSGILGETARAVVDENGAEVMEGYDAFRGSVEDYRVFDALGTNFALLH